jgi:hypothetical protein
MHFVVESRSKKSRAFVEHIMPSMIKQLGLTRSRKVLVVRIANETGDGVDGLTVPFPGIDSFMVVVKPGKPEAMGITLAHEMVHVRQMALGMLKTQNGVNVWRGTAVQGQEMREESAPHPPHTPHILESREACVGPQPLTQRIASLVTNPCGGR